METTCINFLFKIYLIMMSANMISGNDIGYERVIHKIHMTTFSILRFCTLILYNQKKVECHQQNFSNNLIHWLLYLNDYVFSFRQYHNSFWF